MATFAIGVALILPPTELKGSWTSVHYAVPERAYAPVQPQDDWAGSFPAMSYAPPPLEERPATSREAGARDPDYAEEIRIADNDSAYGDGYTWASDREVEDARACRRFRGPRAEGCRDYVASLAPPEAEQPDEPEQPATSW